VIPILLVVNVPARVIAMPLEGQAVGMVLAPMIAAAASLALSRVVFLAAISRYRSASS